MKAQRRRKAQKTLEEEIKTRAVNYRKNWRARALKTGRDPDEVPGSAEIADWLRATLRADGTIIDYFTGQTVPLDKAQVDHITPLSRGGSFHFDNCMLIAARTNRMKGALTAQEFRAFLDFLDSLPFDAALDISDRLAMANTVWRSKK